MALAFEAQTVSTTCSSTQSGQGALLGHVADQHGAQPLGLGQLHEAVGAAPTWASDPGPESISGSHTVWIESTTIRRASHRRRRPRCPAAPARRPATAQPAPPEPFGPALDLLRRLRAHQEAPGPRRRQRSQGLEEQRRLADAGLPPRYRVTDPGTSPTPEHPVQLTDTRRLGPARLDVHVDQGDGPSAGRPPPRSRGRPTHWWRWARPPRPASSTRRTSGSTGPTRPTPPHSHDSSAPSGAAHGPTVEGCDGDAHGRLGPTSGQEGAECWGDPRPLPRPG